MYVFTPPSLVSFQDRPSVLVWILNLVTQWSEDGQPWMTTPVIFFSWPTFTWIQEFAETQFARQAGDAKDYGFLFKYLKNYYRWFCGLFKYERDRPEAEGIQHEFPFSRALSGPFPLRYDDAESIELVMFPSSTPNPLTHTENNTHSLQGICDILNTVTLFCVVLY